MVRAHPASQWTFGPTAKRGSRLDSDRLSITGAWHSGTSTTIHQIQPVESEGLEPSLSGCKPGVLPVGRQPQPPARAGGLPRGTTVLSCGGRTRTCRGFRAALTVRSATSYGLRHNRSATAVGRSPELPRHGSNVVLPDQSRPRCRLRHGAIRASAPEGTRGGAAGLSVAPPRRATAPPGVEPGTFRFRAGRAAGCATGQTPSRPKQCAMQGSNLRSGLGIAV